MKVAIWSAVAIVWLGPTALAKSKRNEPPADLSIRAPRKLATVKVPKDVPREPPADAWWKSEPPCPDGATYSRKEKYGRIEHDCWDKKQRRHGPHTTMGEAGKVEVDGWYRHGDKHGLERVFLPRIADQSWTYVEGKRHGPANEYGDEGDYYRGDRHGRWEIIRSGSTTQHGYYVRGERVGVWLAGGQNHGRVAVLARAKYRNDRPTGTITWWTERGDVLATGKPRGSGVSWQFYAGGKPTVAVSCTDGVATRVLVTRKSKKVTCSYDENGELSQQRGGKGGIGCPRHGLDGLCGAHALDPYAGAQSVRDGLLGR